MYIDCKYGRKVEMRKTSKTICGDVDFNGKNNIYLLHTHKYKYTPFTSIRRCGYISTFHTRESTVSTYSLMHPAMHCYIQSCWWQTSCWNVFAASEPHLRLGLEGLQSCDLLEAPTLPYCLLSFPPLPPLQACPWVASARLCFQERGLLDRLWGLGRETLAHWEKQKQRGAVGRLSSLT